MIENEVPEGQEFSEEAMLERFNEMGTPVALIPGTKTYVRSGQLFEGKTVKGHTNLIIVMENPKDKSGQWIYYLHADKLQKVATETFLKAVEWGDLVPRLAQEVDVGRLSMAAIALDALANRRSVMEQIDAVGSEAELRLMD